MVQIEILATIFDWIFKQQLNLSFLCQIDITVDVKVDGYTGPRRENDVR